MKLIEAPIEEFKNVVIKPSNYLIQNVDDSNFLLHRELKENEISHFIEHKTFHYEEKTYLWVVANFPSEEAAKTAIQSYWNATKQLNEIAK
ncbi:hypothetical protein [Bacillus mycoides]|uniref:hypothetical protein n=1 Tax=Bacillus mycoides TaxID=1405 RepID=UPI000279890C|nr:hypothetical protein [Bacillus mycoides]EJS10671.1 hypothetical protein IKS_05828 [Bacillus cereus VDM062]MED1011323.1 hypothetical protein [Bacillus mycoides]MED1049992.1 hypothetical protein [Bacillus mycoides]